MFQAETLKESSYVDAEKMQWDTSDPKTALRRGESIQEMLKKVKVRRVLMALPDIRGLSGDSYRTILNVFLAFTDYNFLKPLHLRKSLFFFCFISYFLAFIT